LCLCKDGTEHDQPTEVWHLVIFAREVRHVSEIPFTDPVYKDRSGSWFTKFMLRFIRDERDIVFIHQIL